MEEKEHTEHGETIKVAAIKRSDGVILCGRNHAFIIQHSPIGTCKKNSVQGFLTSTARFVDRSEAGEIAFAAGQIKISTNVLFSEDITEDNPWAGEIIERLRVELKELKRPMESAGFKADGMRAVGQELINRDNQIKELQEILSEIEILADKELKARFSGDPIGIPLTLTTVNPETIVKIKALKKEGK